MLEYVPAEHKVQLAAVVAPAKKPEPAVYPVTAQRVQCQLQHAMNRDIVAEDTTDHIGAFQLHIMLDEAATDSSVNKLAPATYRTGLKA